MSIEEIRKRWTVGHYETTVCMYDAWNTYAEAQRDFQIVLAALDKLTEERDEARSFSHEGYLASLIFGGPLSQYAHPNPIFGIGAIFKDKAEAGGEDCDAINRHFATVGDEEFLAAAKRAGFVLCKACSSCYFWDTSGIPLCYRTQHYEQGEHYCKAWRVRA